MLFTFVTDVPNIALTILAWGGALLAWYFLFFHFRLKDSNNRLYHLLIWIVTFCALSPIFQYAGANFGGSDAIASWNRWALELYHNTYHPIDAAYPILFPAMWGLFYKLQGTADIWWTAKITLLVPPIVTLAIILSLFYETRNKTYLVMAFLLYPYLLSAKNFSGFVDMPVMVVGMLSLVLLYTAEYYAKKNNPFSEQYLYAALLVAALASIVKQAGLAFFVFVLLYMVLHRKMVKNRQTVWKVLVLSFSYFGSFLVLYHFHTHYSATNNLKYLGDLSLLKLNASENIYEYIEYLWYHFFSYPALPEWVNRVYALLHIETMTPFLIVVGYLLFFFKDLRKITQINVLASIFFLLGTLIWIRYFSYTDRNSYWVKSFFILFASVNIGYFLQRYEHKITIKIAFLLTFLGILVFSFFQYNNDVVYKRQIAYQKYLGDPKLARYLVDQYLKKSECVQIYISDIMLRYNYYLFPYIDRLHQMLDPYDAIKHIEHSCKDGRLAIFRKVDALSTRWDAITKMTKEKIWQPVDNPFNDDFIFYIPPHKHLDKAYLATKTLMSHFPLTLKSTDDVVYYIDKVTHFELGNDISVKIIGWAFLKGSTSDKTQKYIVLHKGKHLYIVDTIPNIRLGVAKYFHAENLKYSGFLANIYQEDFPKGEYELYLLLIDADNSKHIIKLPNKLHIERGS